MNEKKTTEEKIPEVMIPERRRQRQSELSSAEIMRILRQRAGTGAGKNSTGGSQTTG